jgi:2-polyprenyl-6-methoxyphenol hydroxylase-like FAD-dependent oxidoreductase
MLENGRTVHGDILIGADGIWSQVRTTIQSNKTTILTDIRDCWFSSILHLTVFHECRCSRGAVLLCKCDHKHTAGSLYY